MPKRSKLSYKHSRVLTNKEEEEDKPANNDEIDKDQLLRLKSCIPNYFGLVIYDKAYKLKSPQIRTHRSIHLIRLQKLLLVSTTIYSN
jgi:hypothetical protein